MSEKTKKIILILLFIGAAAGAVFAFFKLKGKKSCQMDDDFEDFSDEFEETERNYTTIPNEAAKDIAEAVQDKVEDIKDAAEDVKEDVADAVKAAFEKAEDTVKDVKEAVSDAVEKAEDDK